MSEIKTRLLSCLIVLLVVFAGALGWYFGGVHSRQRDTDSKAPTATTRTTDAAVSSVKSAVSYSLPDAWQTGDCSRAETVYIIPTGNTLDCAATPSAPIRITLTSQGPTDCNQIMTNTDVKKHTCISLYIHGYKSLKSLTEYPQSSAYAADTTIADYYIDTPKGIVNLNYTYTVSDNYQDGFDRLASSIAVK